MSNPPASETVEPLIEAMANDDLDSMTQMLAEVGRNLEGRSHVLAGLVTTALGSLYEAHPELLALPEDSFVTFEADQLEFPQSDVTRLVTLGLNRDHGALSDWVIELSRDVARHTQIVGRICQNILATRALEGGITDQEGDDYGNE